MHPDHISTPVDAYRTHFDFIWRTLARLGIPPTNREDLAQELYIVVSRRWESYDPEKGSLKSWIFGIARNLVANHRRSSQRVSRKKGAFAEAQSTRPHENTEQLVALGRELSEALDDLSEEQRALWWLIDVEGHSAAEVAAQSGLNVETIYSRIRRTRAVLRKRLGARQLAVLPVLAQSQVQPPEGLCERILDSAPSASPANGASAAYAALKIAAGLLALMLLFALLFTLRPGDENSSLNPLETASRGPSFEVSSADSGSPLGPREREELGPRVIASDDASPIAGATICRLATGRITALDASCTYSDASGHFKVPPQLGPDPTFALDIDAPGFAFRRLRIAELDQAGRTVRLTRRDGEVLSGVVLDSSGGPIEGAVVHAYPGKRGIWGDPGTPGAIALTDDEGRFSLKLPEGLTAVSAYAAGYAASELETAAPETQLLFGLLPESVLEGRITDPQGRPVAGARVELPMGFSRLPGYHSECLSDDKGRYRCPSLIPGEYRVRVLSPGGHAEIEGVMLPFGETLHLDLQLRPVTPLEGDVYVAGEPCAKPSGGFSADRHDIPAQAVPGHPGRLRFPSIPADMTGEVRVHCPGARFLEMPIDPRQLENSPLRWELSPSRLSAHGYIQRDAELIGSKLRVSYWTEREPADMADHAEVDPESGRFEIYDLAPGTYRLRAEALGFEGATKTIDVGVDKPVEEVELLLTPVPRLSGRIQNRGSGSIAGGLIAVHSVDGNGGYGRGQVRSDGTFVLDWDIAPGEYELIFSINGATPKVANGPEETLPPRTLFTLPAGPKPPPLDLYCDFNPTALRGRVVNLEGDGVPDLLVRARAYFPEEDTLTGDSPFAAVTNDTGNFEFPQLIDRPYRLVIERPGEGAVISDVVTPEQTPTLLYTARAELSARVRGLGHDPSPNFDVLVTGEVFHRQTTFPASREQFTLSDISDGSHWLYVRHGTTSGKTRVELHKGTLAGSPPDITLWRDCPLRVRPLGEDTRAPLTDMEAVAQTESALDLKARQSRQTADGTIHTSIPAGSREVDISYAYGPDGLYQGETIPVTCRDGETIDLGDIVLDLL